MHVADARNLVDYLASPSKGRVYSNAVHNVKLWGEGVGPVQK
jgi:hypothetical protein